ncbi:MAG: hypothetical protein AB1631_07665 [Acidobacteriota bacterium]
MKKIPVLICIDVEPDERAINPHRADDWKGFEKIFGLFRQLRPRLERTTRSTVHLSWFLRMDPQIARVYGSASWVAARYRRLIEEMLAAGDEVGLHTHAWAWEEKSQRWIQDFGNQTWVAHCVSSSFKAFRQSFNRPCLSFRFGDHWMNDATLEMIGELGARFDMTLEPGRKGGSISEPFTGCLPDYSQVPRHPYYPSPLDFRKRASGREGGVCIIPVSTGSLEWASTVIRERDAKATNDGNANAVYEGYHDEGDPRAIIGWVWDMNRPDRILDVEIYDGDDLIAIATAGAYRPDLLRARKGDGRHAFRCPVPERIKDGRKHSIRVKVAGSSFDLYSTPRKIRCSSQSDHCEQYVPLNLMHDSLSFCLIMDHLLATEPYLNLVVRSDAANDRGAGRTLEDNLDYILSRSERFSFVTPAEMIERLT